MQYNRKQEKTCPEKSKIRYILGQQIYKKRSFL